MTADAGIRLARAREVASGIVLADRLRLARTHWTRLRGLLGTRGLAPGEGLWLAPCRQVHMLGMRYPIDVVFLDPDGRVVRTVAGLAPGRISPRVPDAASVLELPAGTLARTGVAEGARIDIEPGAGQPAVRDVLGRSMLAFLIVVGLLCLAIDDRADPDLWGHVRYGEEVIATGHLPRTATHTFTAPDQPWINHENAAELVFAVAFLLAGTEGLAALRWFLGLIVLGLLVRRGRRRGVSPPVLAAVVLLVAFNLAPWWTTRPQLFTETFFAVMVLVLDRVADEAPAARRLWPLPLLFAVWANTHGGFLAGGGVLVLYLGVRGVELLWTRGRTALPTVAGFAAVVVACALATLLNPYGLDLLVWLVRDVGPPRPEITEWAALSTSHPEIVPFAILAIVAVASWVASPRRGSVAEPVVLVATAWQALAHLRHIPFFALAAGIWVPPWLEGLRARRVAPTGAAAAPPRAAVLGVQLVTVVLVLVLGRRLGTIEVSKGSYPVEAFSYMASERLYGRLVVDFDWAQYAIAAFAPATSVAFDGRFRTSYPQAIADMNFDFFIGDLPGKRWRRDGSHVVDPTRVLKFGAPDLVLLRRGRAPAEETVRADGGWVLLYQDAIAQLWGRRSRYDDPGSGDYVPPARRSITDRPQSGSVPWPALPAVI